MDQLGHPYRTAAPPRAPEAAVAEPDDATLAFAVLEVLVVLVCGLRLLVARAMHEPFGIHSDAVRAVAIGAVAAALALRSFARLRRTERRARRQ